jgi:pimeloyl-ACP methyl ester carboxylesterase
MGKNRMSAPEYAMKSTSRGIVYTQRGVGSPVILVHGWCLSRELWTYHEESLASAGYKVVSLDLPGFGDSRGLAGPYNLDRYVNELEGFIDELKLDRVVVVGFAFGAAVAMAMAARHDSRLAGLVLIGLPSATHAPYERMPRAMRRDWPEFAWKSASAICKRPQSQATLYWLSEMFRATPLPVALETVAVLGRFEPVPLAGQVTVETLLVHGQDDDVVPVAISMECADQMANGTLEVVGESGHLVVLDQQLRLSDILKGFMTRVLA